MDVNTATDINHIVTEDDTPVDNFASEKQQRLLTEPLYSSWQGRYAANEFLAAANVGLFYAVRQPPIVPDVFLSLDVTVAEDWWKKQNRSYFFWEFGKPPEVVIEIVSNTEGNELGSKLQNYARMRIIYYVVFDPKQQLKGSMLQVYQLQATTYAPMTEFWLESVELGLKLWEGVFEGKQDLWLRWCDTEGNVIPTGAERAETERQRAETERQRAETERQRAETERQRAETERQRAETECQRAETAESQLEQERQKAERLAARLRSLGINPDETLGEYI